MRGSSILLCLGSLAIAAPLAAGASASVNAEDFYSTAVELEKKGFRALFDKRAKSMEAQMKDAGASARQANAAASKTGNPLYCVSDAERKKGLNVSQVLAMLGALGQETRSKLTLERAWLLALKRKYPCTAT